MIELAALLITGLGLCAVMATIKATTARQLRDSLVAYRLSFPRGLEAEAAVNFLAGLTGLLLPWWRRWRVTPFVVFETLADDKSIVHQLLVPKPWSHIVESVLQASVPSVRFTPIGVTPIQATVAAEYRLTNQGRSLNINAEMLAAHLLHSMQPLERNQKVMTQWVITPSGPVTPVTSATAATTSGSLFRSTSVPANPEAAAALKAKQSSPLFLGMARIGTVAETRETARRLLRMVEASWHETRAPGVHLTRRLSSERTAARALMGRHAPVTAWPGTYNTRELVGLIGWPVGAISVPGLVLGGARLLAASPSIPTTGTVLADSTYPGNTRPLAIDLEGRLRHIHVLGATGTGKSTLLVWMLLADLEAGRSAVLLDPKGDLVQAILERVKPEHRDRIVVLDPADNERVVGLNPLHAVDSDRAEVVVENLVGLFKSLYSTSWGPRLDDIMRASLTLAASSGSTLCEISPILGDPSFRRRLLSRVNDPVGLEFWSWYESLSDAERVNVTGPVLNKVRAFTMRPRVRAIIGQSKPRISIAEVMGSGKVLLCSLASGVLGDEAAALLGALIVSELWNATGARAALPVDQRPPVMAYLDEWQNFLHLPTPMAQVLAEARGLGLGMTLSHQEMQGQLTTEARHAVLANARSRVMFALSAADAKLMASQLGGLLSADDLRGLGAFEVAGQIHAAGSTQAPVTGRTRPLSPPVSDPEEIRRESRERFGVAREEVEGEIRKRQTGPMAGTIGRRRSQRSGGGDHE